MSSIIISLLGSAPLEKTGPSTDSEKVKGGPYLKEILILNSFSFEDKDPRFYKAKTRLLSKGLSI